MKLHYKPTNDHRGKWNNVDKCCELQITLSDGTTYDLHEFPKGILNVFDPNKEKTIALGVFPREGKPIEETPCASICDGCACLVKNGYPWISSNPYCKQTKKFLSKVEDFIIARVGCDGPYPF